ncbi:MAG: DUF4974 domain-containing protein [Flavobacteriaceae bacterium]
MDKNIKNIIRRYLEGTLSKADTSRLSDWVKDKENRILFENTLQEFYRNDAFNTKKALERFQQSIVKNKVGSSKKHRVLPYLKYAAVLIGMVFVLSMVLRFNSDNPIIIDQNEITLVIGEDDVQVLNDSMVIDINAKNGNRLAKQHGRILNYTGSDGRHLPKVFNTLHIPYGKTFGIKLSDNSYVHLNAGSKLRFPVQFIEGEPREVFLEGEGYFKVAKNSGSPFIVRANNVSTQVFGTEFNVSAYKEDAEAKIVLVEGSIGVFGNSEKYDPLKDVLLKPNEMATTSTGKEVRIDQVDVGGHVAWVKGALQFKNEDFNTIARKLQRFYNIVITNNNLALTEKKFTGRFDIETVEQILETFRKTNSFNYTIEGRHIIINP